jgi:hypothetical protein
MVRRILEPTPSSGTGPNPVTTRGCAIVVSLSPGRRLTKSRPPRNSTTRMRRPPVAARCLAARAEATRFASEHGLLLP